MFLFLSVRSGLKSCVQLIVFAIIDSYIVDEFAISEPIFIMIILTVFAQLFQQKDNWGALRGYVSKEL